MIETPVDEHLDVTEYPLDTVPTATVHEVTLTRPAKRNALPIATIESLAELFASIDCADGDALVIDADGEDFSLGADLGDLHPAELDDPEALSECVQDLVTALRECPLPTVASVQGRTYGAGFLVCLGVDFVVASENTTFGLPEVNLGIPISGFATALLPKLVGERRAREWLFTGRDIDAEEAEDAGFVTRTTSNGIRFDEVDSLLGQLVDGSTATISALKVQMAPISVPDEDDARIDEQTAMRTAYEENDAPDRISRLLR